MARQKLRDQLPSDREQGGTSLYEQSPPLGIDLPVVSPAQRRSQVALEQLTEHEFVQVMWQVELPPHEALPLGPSVAVQVELPVQFRLQESPHAPTHSVWFEQEIEQLPALPPQAAALKEQLDPELQVQLAPLQAGGGAAEEPPQAWRRTTNPITAKNRMTDRSTANGRFKPPLGDGEQHLGGFLAGRRRAEPG
jgi:hypothetical protein